MPVGRRTQIAVLAFLFPLSALLCQLQYEKATRPESPAVLEMYLSSDLPLLFTSRVLPRLGILAIHGLTGGRLSYEHANALLQLACIWGTLFLTFQFARTYLSPTPALAAAFLTALFPIWGLVRTAGLYTYPYDFPTLLFSTAGLLAIARRRHAWLFLLVFLGAASKETIFWLVPAYLLVISRAGEPRGRLLVRTTVLCLLFAVAYEMPRVLLDPAHVLHFTVQPSWSGKPRYLNNLSDLLFLNQRNVFTNVWYPFALHAPAVLCFARLHGDLRRLYWATPFLLVPVFFFGNITEARLFNEVVPLGAVSAMCVFARHWGDTTREQPGALSATGAAD